MKSLYYFGCGPNDTGHYWFEGRSPMYGELRSALQKKLPWKEWREDGGFCPKTTIKQGLIALHHIDGWTVASWWDSSMDKRPGSSSTFVAPVILTLDEMLLLAQTQYPWVFSRIHFDLKSVAT